MVALEDHGVGAVVLPSLFEEQIVLEAQSIHSTLEAGTDSFGEAGDWFPPLPSYDVGPDRYLTRVEEAKARLGVPVIASLNASSVGGWVRYAKLLEQAGADALELNVYDVHVDPQRTAAEVEAADLELAETITSLLEIPVAVKLSPYYSAFAGFAVRMAGAGVAGLVLFNRFYQPDLDLETLDVLPSVELSSSWELRLPLRWIAVLREQLPCSLAATSGVHDGHDVAKALLVGADVAMTTSALLRHGPAHVATMEEQLVRWMVEHEYTSVRQLRGSVRREAAANPEAFERSSYARTLSSWR
jgi:dihydroorotate dehydrogenase (fumarate)